MEPETTYTQLYRDTIPSVVSVYPTGPDADRPPAHGAGSGFVYDEFGYLVTNAHVVGPATEVNLRFADGK